MHENNNLHNCAGGICEDGVCDDGSCCEADCGGGCCYDGSDCGCWHHNIFAFLLIVFGLTFLLGAFQIISGETVNVIWPILVVIAGIKKLFGGMCKCC